MPSTEDSADLAPRLPFILAYAADMHGCGWHRILSPGIALARAGRAYVRVASQMVPIEQLQASRPAAIIFQRQVEEGQLAYMEEVRRALPETKLVYELDDRLSAVDAENFHEAFLAPPEELDARIGRALALCDAAVCPTLELQKWLSRLAPQVPVAILPNLLPELDGHLPPIKKRKPGHRMRVGWAGGISHDGDLAQLTPAIKRLVEAQVPIEFIFMGMRPPGLDPDSYRYHPGVPPHDFGGYWAALDLDLVLAPVVDSEFNRAKSNLRLLQAALPGGAVIASPVGEYLNCPTIWGWASSPEEWEERIRAWLDASEHVRFHARQEHRLWAKKFGMQGGLEAIADCWLVPRAGGPKALPSPSGKWLWWGMAEPERLEAYGAGVQASKANSVAAAYAEARESGAGLIVGRPGGTFIRARGIQKMLALAASTKQPVGSISCWSNDGACGAGLFGPRVHQMDPDSADDIAKVVAGLGESETPLLPFPVGPLAILPAKAVQAVAAWPSDDNLTTAMVEWGMVAAATGFQHILCRQAWATTQAQGQPLDGPSVQARALLIQTLPASLQSPEMAAWKRKAELAYLKEYHKLPVPPGEMAQQLETWSAFFAGPRDLEAKPKSVARVALGDQAALDAVRAAGSKWLRFDIPDVILTDAGLAEMEAAGDAAGADVVYCDWLSLLPEGKSSPVLLPSKADWYYGLGRDWLSAAVIIRTSAFKAVSPPADRYKLWFHLMHAFDARKHLHYPRMLAAGPENLEVAGRKEALAGMGLAAEEIPNLGFLKVRPEPLQDPAPSVSIIIPTTGDPWILRPCLATLSRYTGYPGPMQIILVVSGDEEARGIARAAIRRIKEAEDAIIVDVNQPFSYPVACNAGAGVALGRFLLFLNDDIRFGAPGWLSDMVAWALRPDIGWVGPRLVKPDGSVQLTGIYAGAGCAAELMKGLPKNELGFGGYAHLVHATGAVCGACALIEAAKFHRIGCFDPAFQWNYNDVMAGVQARRAGLTNLYITNHDIMHMESASRGKAGLEVSLRRLREDGRRLAAALPEPDETFPEALEIKPVMRRTGVVGTQYSTLKWEQPEGARTLVIGRNFGEIAQLVRAGKRVFVAGIQGNKLHMLNPPLVNGQPLALDDTAGIQELLEGLGIEAIECCPVEGEETVFPGVAQGWLREAAAAA